MEVSLAPLNVLSVGQDRKTCQAVVSSFVQHVKYLFCLLSMVEEVTI